MPNLPSDSSETERALPDIPMADVARFIRQLSHDLRNHLNAAELQSAYLGEIAADEELKEEVTRLRSMLSEMGGSLQRLTTLMARAEPTVIPYEAAAFVEDLRKKLETRSPEASAAIEWQVDLGAEMIEMDPQLLQEAMLELFTNAFLHGRGEGPIKVTAERAEAQFRFTLEEPKKEFAGSMEKWGAEPFRKTSHGHYGLGLPRVRDILEKHGGNLSARFDSGSSALVSVVVLPLAATE